MPGRFPDRAAVGTTLLEGVADIFQGVVSTFVTAEEQLSRLRTATPELVSIRGLASRFRPMRRPKVTRIALGEPDFGLLDEPESDEQ